jgi:hypothetical protein
MATKTKKRKGPKSGGGLAPTIYRGLNENRMRKGSNTPRLILKQGDTATVQFLTSIKEFREYDMHQFQERNRWQYVPCAGDGCPLCEDEDPDVSKISYRFCCCVWVPKEKKVLILEGPKDLSGRIALRFKGNKKKFTKRMYDVSKLKTTPVSYDVERSDGRTIDPDSVELIDLDKFIVDEMERYFGDSTPKPSSKGRSSLDDDDDDDDDDADEDEYDEDELDDMELSEVKSIAKSLGIALKTKDGEKRKKSKLIQLILKKQG